MALSLNQALWQDKSRRLPEMDKTHTAEMRSPRQLFVVLPQLSIVPVQLTLPATERMMRLRQIVETKATATTMVGFVRGSGMFEAAL